MASSRRGWLVACAAGTLAAASRWAGAQEAGYPSRPLRFVIPFAPGGPADAISRLVGSRLQEQFGQPVVFENIPGAGSTLGVGRLAKMPADGYAIGFAHSGSMSIGPSLYKTVGYDPLQDLTPIARLCNYVNLLVDAPNTSAPLVKAGKLRVLAATGTTRHAQFPEAPAIAESLPGYEFKGWMGVVAPRGLPVAVQKRLTNELDKAMAAPGAGERLAALGLDVAFGDPGEVTRTVAAELQLWGPLIKSLNLKVE